MLPLRTLFPGSYLWEVNFQEAFTRWVEMGDTKRAGMIFRLFKSQEIPSPLGHGSLAKGRLTGNNLRNGKRKIFGPARRSKRAGPGKQRI
jgi:hypothetical protein